MKEMKSQNNKWLKICGLGLMVLIFTTCVSESEKPEQFDKLIVNGKVLDGTGNPWFYADIAINGDEIVKIGNLKDAAAHDIIDARGLYVTPGFIDEHSHAGSGLAKPELSSAKPLLYQGITTIFANPDGSGAVDLNKQRRALLKDGLGVNVGLLVPFGSVRRKAMGREDRAPTSQEMEEMKQLVEAGMKEGAFGLSTGIFYAPQSYASNEEVIELAKVAAQYGGIYQSHIRDESNYTVGVEAAVNEVIQVAREAELPGIVTHIKALGPPVWGLSSKIVANIEQARAEGVEMFASQYPYLASATGLISALVPRWAEDGGHKELVKRLNDAGLLPRIQAEMKENLARRGGANRIQFRRYTPDSSIEGKTLEEVAKQHNLNAVDMAIKLIKKGSPRIVSFNMSEEDVNRFMQQPWTMTGSDGGLVELGQGVPHPRNYGSFPRKIRKFVMEKEVVSLSSAIRSMTSLPAQVFGLRDRGIIREGAKADIAIFDLDELTDKAVFQDPHQYSEGMKFVLISGKYALKDGEVTSQRLGRVLSRTGQ